VSADAIVDVRGLPFLLTQWLDCWAGIFMFEQAHNVKMGEFHIIYDHPLFSARHLCHKGIHIFGVSWSSHMSLTAYNWKTVCVLFWSIIDVLGGDAKFMDPNNMKSLCKHKKNVWQIILMSQTCMALWNCVQQTIQSPHSCIARKISL